MIAIGRLLKAENPKLKVVFIGPPCIAKKSEARQPELAGAVDFVLTFEETAAMLQAGGIEVDGATQTADLADASHDGRIYGRSGGISTAIVRSINTLAPSLEVRIQRGNGIKECSQLLKLAEQGLLDATFIEGMACVGGCVGGPGKLIPPQKPERPRSTRLPTEHPSAKRPQPACPSTLYQVRPGSEAALS